MPRNDGGAQTPRRAKASGGVTSATGVRGSRRRDGGGGVSTDRVEAAPRDPLAVLKSRRDLGLLVVTAILGVPLAVVAYGFLKFSNVLASWVYSDLPSGLGFHTPPTWWPLPVLAVGGVVVAAVVRYLPGEGGEEPSRGFHPGGAPTAAALPGIALAALATLGCGAVLGPEAPLIALGSGLAVLAVRTVNRGAPAQVIAVVGAAGSFAA